MAIDWSLANPGGNMRALAGGLQLGMSIRDRRDAREAERMRFEQDQAKAQQQAEEAHRKMVTDVAGLLEGATDEETYQRGLAAAGQLGYGEMIAQAPRNFDPAWVAQQRLIFQVARDKPDALPGLAREVAIATGIEDPNDPQFKQVFRQALEGKYASDYVDSQGNIRRRSIFTAQPQQQAAQPAQQGGQNGAFSFDAWRGAVNSLGPDKAAAFLQRNGITVSVRTPDEARQLPSGTPIILPDGTQGRVP